MGCRAEAPRRRRQRGLAAVELAVLLPVFILLLVAAGELGRAIYQFNTLTKAVRDGARYAAENAVNGSTGVIDLTAAKIATARNLVLYGSPAGGDQTTLPGLEADDVAVTVLDTQHILVTASYDFVPVLGVLPALPPLSPGGSALANTFTASCAMRVL